MKNVTFGVCVGPSFELAQLTRLLLSIDREFYNYTYGITGGVKHNFRYNHEVILIGDSKLILADDKNDFLKKFRIIHFDENEKRGWITRKKNILADAASYENLVLLHDYYELLPGWMEGYLKFTNYYPDWELMMNEVLNMEMTRGADWMLNPEILRRVCEENSDIAKKLMEVAPHENAPWYVNGLPYKKNGLEKFQYISGGYIVCKRHVLDETPFNENLTWGQSEDVEWSQRLDLSKYYFNEFSRVGIQKPNKWKVTEIPNDLLSEIEGLL